MLLESIPVILQVASLLAALAHPGHIVIYAPGDSLPCRRDVSEIHRVYKEILFIQKHSVQFRCFNNTGINFFINTV
ncbi:hypothetical protein EAE92_16840 [Photorhabdus hainanensis]|nr:hypothetical protein [Photorhabdus hainanensis]